MLREDVKTISLKMHNYDSLCVVVVMTRREKREKEEEEEREGNEDKQ